MSDLAYTDTFTREDDERAHAWSRWRLQHHILDTVRERFNIDPQVHEHHLEHNAPLWDRVSLSWAEFIFLLSNLKDITKEKPDVIVLP